MTIYCQFHPTVPAHYQCPRCQSHLCPQCIDRRERGDRFPGQHLRFCPKCNVQVRWLGAGNIVTPFWKRLPKFFTYPFHPRPLTLMAIISLINLLAANHPGLLSIPVILLAYCAVLLYSFAALKRTASGDMSPPPLNKSSLSDDFHLVIKQVVMFVIIGFTFFAGTASLGPLVGVAILVVVLLGFPAMVILLITTGSLIQAINPMMFIPLATRIGWGYLLMYLFLILLGGAPSVLAGKIIPIFPERAIPFIFSMAKFYYMLISYHLMGYVLMQYHMEIGYDIDEDNFRESDAVASVAPLDADAATLKEVERLLREGEVESAVDLIRKDRNPAAIRSLALSSLYMKMLKLKRMAQALDDHRPVHLGLLAKNGEKREALQLYDDMKKRDAGRIPGPDTLFAVAGWLNEAGRYEPALAAYGQMAESYPDSPLVPKARFRAAQITHDRLMEAERAREMLDDLVDDFPDHEIIGQVKAYRSHM